jgi:hypothetical protein
MKLKRFTLLAFIGVLILVMQDLFYVLVNFGVITHVDAPALFFQIVNAFSFPSRILIALFFIKLYKNQK